MNFGQFYRTGLDLFLLTYSTFAVTTCELAICCAVSHSVAVRYLDCVNVDGQSVVFSSPAITCGTSRYAGYLSLVMIYFILLVVGVPIAIFYLLRFRYHHLLQTRAGAEYHELRSRLGVLFVPFAPHAYLWQIPILIRRLLCVIADAFLQGGPRNMLFSLIHFAFFVLHVHVRPSANPKVDRLESANLILLVVISCILTGFPSNYQGWEQAVISILVIGPIVLFVVGAVVYKRLPSRRKTVSTLESHAGAQQSPRGEPAAGEALADLPLESVRRSPTDGPRSKEAVVSDQSPNQDTVLAVDVATSQKKKRSSGADKKSRDATSLATDQPSPSSGVAADVPAPTRRAPSLYHDVTRSTTGSRKSRSKLASDQPLADKAKPIDSQI